MIQYFGGVVCNTVLKTERKSVENWMIYNPPSRVFYEWEIPWIVQGKDLSYGVRHTLNLICLLIGAEMESIVNIFFVDMK